MSAPADEGCITPTRYYTACPYGFGISQTCLHRGSTAVSYLFLSTGLPTPHPLRPSVPFHFNLCFASTLPCVDANPTCPPNRKNAGFSTTSVSIARWKHSRDTFSSIAINTGLTEARIIFCTNYSVWKLSMAQKLLFIVFIFHKKQHLRPIIFIIQEKPIKEFGIILYSCNKKIDNARFFVNASPHHLRLFRRISITTRRATLIR